MISPRIIRNFIKLVTDGSPISDIEVCPTCKHGHYGPIGRQRKGQFLQDGHAIMHELSLHLGCFGPGPYHGRWTEINEAGGSVSGSVHLFAEHVHVTFEHYVNIRGVATFQEKGFSFRDPRENDVAGWLPWESLADLEACAREIQAQLALKLPFNWRAHLEGNVEKGGEGEEEVGSELNSKSKQALP